MAKYKFNIGDRVRFKTNYFTSSDCESLEGRVFTITGQSWFNGPTYYVNLPVYFPSRTFCTFSEDAFEDTIVGRA
jgi:hypothetical protein